MGKFKFKMYIILFSLLFVFINSNVYANSKTVAVISGKSYASLQKAVNAVKNGETITLLENVSTKTQVKINKPKKSFTINFAGNTYKYTGTGKAFLIQSGNVTVKNINIISKNYAFYIKKSAQLTITSGKCYGYHYNAGTCNIVTGSFSTRGAKKSDNDELIQNHGEMTINNGNFYGLCDNAIYNFGNLLIKGGNYKSTVAPENEVYYPVILNWKKAVCNIIKGNVSGNGMTIENVGGIVTINDGNYTSSFHYVIGNVDNGTFTINNGKFTGNSHMPLLGNQNGYFTIKGGTYKGQMQNSTTGNYKMAIYNGNFSSSDYPLLVDLKGTVEIKGGTFISQNNNTICNDKEGILKIWGGNFSCTDYFYVLYNYGKAYLSGGEFRVKDSYNSIASLKGSVLQVGANVKYTGDIDYK